RNLAQTQDESRRPPPAPGPGAPAGPRPEGSGYERLHRLGAGQFGEVWKARAPGGVEVAVKILHHPAGKSEATKRELKSPETIKTPRPPCLLAPEAIGTGGDRLWIAMELADGTLRDRLNQCRGEGQPGIPVSELYRYLRDAAEGIDYLHTQHVLHRDIKPDNILLLQGHAKVADFVLARLQTHQMATVSFAGTPVYMAPELWQNKAGPQSDLYSLAFTYVELRTGHRPIPDDEFIAIMAGQLQRELNLSGLESVEQTVVRKALSKAPEQRQRTCMEFVAELRRALKGQSGSGKVVVTPAGGTPV